MKNYTKALILFLLSLFLCLTANAVPTAVTVFDSADEVGIPSASYFDEALLSADGSEVMPYTISTAEEFNRYADLVNNNNDDYADKYYKLSCNIDFEGVEMVPFGISSEKPFKGTLDGNGYALLNVSIPDKLYSGVVGYMTKGTIKDLRVEYASFETREEYTTVKYFGGVLGYSVISSSNDTISIINCETSGDILIHSKSALYAGGIIGYIKCSGGVGAVSNCVTHTSFDVEGDKNSYISGFAAYVSVNSGMGCTFKDCVSYGDVSAVINNSEATAGGFCAYVRKDESGWTGWASDEDDKYDFENCVAYGNVYGESKSKTSVGGFIAQKNGEGDLVMTNCYRNSSQIIDGSAATYNETSSYGTQTPKENLISSEFYSSTLGFDFANKWYMSGSRLHLRNVAKSHGAAVISEDKDLRLTHNPGVRFISVIDTFKRDYSFEYGFIIAVAEELGNNELTFDYDGKMIKGVAYDKDTDTDIFLDYDDEYIVFTGVVHSIPEQNYSAELVARTYVKYICDGNEVVVYGNIQSSSINLSAQAVRDSEVYDELSQEHKDLLDSMLPLN